MGGPDPLLRCSLCRAYWSHEAEREGLKWSDSQDDFVCRDVTACERRRRTRARLDAITRRRAA